MPVFGIASDTGKVFVSLRLSREKLIILKFNIYVKFYVAPKVHSRATEGLQ